MEIIKNPTNKIKRVIALISLILSLVTAVFSLLTLGIDAISADRRLPEVSKRNIMFLGA